MLPISIYLVIVLGNNIIRQLISAIY